jgi:hypothetical protein
MSFPDGNIGVRFYTIAFLLLLIPYQNATCQKNILDSTFTFKAGIIKTGNALELISRRTGYNFTYDTRLIDAVKKTEMTFSNTKLGVILDSILMNKTLNFSVIDKYIIISRDDKYRSENSDDSIADNVSYITGNVIDEETLEPLPYAAIALKNKGRGTVSNMNGEFGLKITPDLVNDTLAVTYLGFIGREIGVCQAIGSSLTISMKRDFISIPEIIIKNQIPQDIINKARLAIPLNFGNTPALMTGFYREGVMKKNELQTYSEAILQLYKSAYSGSFLSDQIKVLKSRKIENVNRTDTLAIRLKAGLSTCVDLDGARNTFDFLDKDRITDYIYRITDIVTYDDESAYVIEFEQRENVDNALYKGVIYINTVDYGILHAEFELNQSLILKVKSSFVSNSAPGFNTWPVSVKYSVSYRKMNNRYFLNHVRGDLMFISNQKKKLFNKQFSVFFELAVTDITLENVSRFDREELTPMHSIFSETIKDYDSNFWGNQDFLRPEDNLLQALKNMKVKLQEFSK